MGRSHRHGPGVGRSTGSSPRFLASVVSQPVLTHSGYRPCPPIAMKQSDAVGAQNW
jgi:hypothetical protein